MVRHQRNLVSMVKLDKYNGTPKTVVGSMEKGLGDEHAKLICDKLQGAYRNGKMIAALNSTPSCVERLEKVVFQFNRSSPSYRMAIEYYSKRWGSRPTFCVYIFEK